LTALYRPLGSVLSFPIPIRNTLGQLAAPTSQSVLLFANDEPQAVEMQGVTFRQVADVLWYADADSSTPGMEDFFAEGNEISAWSKDVAIEGESGFGDYLRRVYIMGDPPSGGSAGSGSQIVRLAVVDAGATPIEGIRVTAYDSNGRFAATGVSNSAGEIVLHLMPGTYDLSSPSIPGRWEMANPTQTIVVAEDSPNAFDVEFVAMPITPPEAGRATGWLVLLGNDQQPLSGGKVNIVAVTPPAEGLNSDAGLSPPDTPWEKTSPAGGLVEYPGLLVGWEYQIWGEGLGFNGVGYFTVPLSALNDPNGFPIRQFVRKAA
jgi:hypothetical protein